MHMRDGLVQSDVVLCLVVSELALYILRTPYRELGLPRLW